MTAPTGGGEAAREIAITRVYAAPREAVWAAWTEPAQLARWWGRRGWRTPPESLTMDVRPGGAFRLRSIADDGAEMAQAFVYREVVAPERLVFADAAGETATVLLRDLGDGRTQMDFRTTMRAAPALVERARGGLSSAFDRLGEHLTTPPPKEAPR